MEVFFRELDSMRLQIGEDPLDLYESAARAALSARFEFGEAPRSPASATVFTTSVGTVSTRPLQANKNPTRESGVLR